MLCSPEGFSSHREESGSICQTTARFPLPGWGQVVYVYCTVTERFMPGWTTQYTQKVPAAVKGPMVWL